MTGKKILIVSNNLHVGGVQKSLYNLLWSLSGQYDISLILFYCSEAERSYIPENVRLIPLHSPYRYLGMTRQDACGTFFSRIARSFYAAVTRLLGRNAAIALMAPFQTKIKGYDIAISFIHNAGSHLFFGGCNDFVLKHVEAKRKIAFLHCDYQKSGANTKKNARDYTRFDAIAACSNGCARQFIEALPILENKVTTVPNFHRFEQIKKYAEEEVPHLPDDVINVVTIARLGKEKGVHRAVDAIAQLGGLKKQMQYHIVGDGIERNNIQHQIERLGLQSNVILWGEKKNPYGFIKAADLLLIPSYSEAAPMVIGEAACLGTPILSTETSSAQDMITKPEFGWVCENSTAGITSGLRMLLESPDLLVEMNKHLATKVYDNWDAEFQIAQLLKS